MGPDGGPNGAEIKSGVERKLLVLGGDYGEGGLRRDLLEARHR